MCYINGIRVSLTEYISFQNQQWELQQMDRALLNQPAMRGFEYGPWPIITTSADATQWILQPMEWGFIPDYITDEEALKKFRYGYKDANGIFKPPYTTLNAIGEELLQPGKMFSHAAKHHRCLVLSSGFYEYRHVTVMGKKGKPLKTPEKFPYYIGLKTTGEYFFMAGIYNCRTDRQTGEMRHSFAIVTTAANALMAGIHNSKKRMPVILTEALAAEWIQPNLSEERINAIACYQFPANEMMAYTVAKDFLQQEEPYRPFAFEHLPAI